MVGSVLNALESTRASKNEKLFCLYLVSWGEFVVAPPLVMQKMAALCSFKPEAKPIHQFEYLQDVDCRWSQRFKSPHTDLFRTNGGNQVGPTKYYNSTLIYLLIDWYFCYLFIYLPYTMFKYKKTEFLTLIKKKQLSKWTEIKRLLVVDTGDGSFSPGPHGKNY